MEAGFAPSVGAATVSRWPVTAGEWRCADGVGDGGVETAEVEGRRARWRRRWETAEIGGEEWNVSGRDGIRR